MIRRHARRTITLLALTETIARSGVTFIDRIAVRRNGRTRPDRPGDVARFATIGADRVTTNAIDTIGALALRAVGARITVCLLDLARRGITEVPVVAFTTGYARGLASSTYAAVTRLARHVELLHAHALTITCIGGILRREICARCRRALGSERIFGATRTARTRAGVSTRIGGGDLTLAVGIGIARNGSAIAIHARALFGRRARLAFTRTARTATNTVDTIARIAFGIGQTRGALGLLDARLARGLTQSRNAIVVREARFADDTLHRANFTAIGVGFGTVFQTVHAAGLLALVLEAVSADAVDTDDATFAVRTLLCAASTAIEIRFIAADFAVVGTAEKPVVDNQVAIIVDTVAFFRNKAWLGIRYAFGRTRHTRGTFELSLVTRRPRVFRKETRIIDAGNSIIDAAITIVIETVAKLHAR